MNENDYVDNKTKLTQEHIDFINGMADTTSMLDAVDILKEKFEVDFFDAGNLLEQWLKSGDWTHIEKGSDNSWH